jgi:hypothetical protein
MTISLKALLEEREQLKAGLTQVSDLRRGSLTARFRKCGKSNCHGTQKDSAGHGPSYSLTHASGGKTITQAIPQGPAVDRTRAQIAEYRRFRKLVQELIAVSEQLCNAQLQQPEANFAEESKKNLFADLLATDVVQEIETLLGHQAVEDLDLEALELAVRQQVLQLAGAAVEQRLNADTSDERGLRTRCGCGQEARLVGRRSKQVQSVLGPLQRLR